MQIDLDEVLELLRLYRHDLMNDLQLIHGYASMNKHKESMARLNELISNLRDERQLQLLDAPKFVYWMFELKLNHRHLDVSIKVEPTEHSFLLIERQALEDGKRLINMIESNEPPLDYIELDIEIKHTEQWNIIYRIKDNDENKSFESSTPLSIEHNNGWTSFVFSYK